MGLIAVNFLGEEYQVSETINEFLSYITYPYENKDIEYSNSRYIGQSLDCANYTNLRNKTMYYHSQNFVFDNYLSGKRNYKFFQSHL